MDDRIEIRRALVSVYDKTDLVAVGKVLSSHGVDIVSTGSTAALLAQAGVAVIPVEEVTGFPECLDGRVKTLHPRIHAGILADRRRPSHVAELAEMDMAPFDLVVSNLYPFTDTVAAGADVDACVEQIDIGGPSMVRAAAKNHPSVAVVTSPSQYARLIEAVNAGGFTLAERQQLATQAFIHTAAYDVAVATWMTEVFGGQQSGEAEQGSAGSAGAAGTVGSAALPGWIGQTYTLSHSLRYGENSHQAAALYVAGTVQGSGNPSASDRGVEDSGPGEGATPTWVIRPGLAGAVQLGGKEMSYNNYTDTEAAYRACHDFDAPTVAIIKHANPCGIALGSTIAEAHRKAHACDSLSAYGGVVAANREVSKEMALGLKGIFTEVIIAPSYEPEALVVLQKKKNLRILQAGPYVAPVRETKAISGGLLVQEPDRVNAPGDDPGNWELKAGPGVDEAALRDLVFAWRAVRAVKSNAILLAHDEASVGVGMGQVNRVDSCRLAVERAGDRAAGSVAASDAFFPFADGPQILFDAGVTAIVEPGGSIHDEDTITACQAAGVSLYFTGTRHFFH
ncbi:MAG: bifunctional phosphoribosylaminoimidazolecarboxamide formyltransferase/inosine monophosphate cyclohydrolase [Propionibacteriaceae bacterium]|nr:bifunctional phosphoribosylaminoimidazolecarboxamide formyltransferase/inosine monophosphate cyclohydrolase [Propionibacteriaceae bacterium]